MRRSLLEPQGWEGSDVYYVIGSFAAYHEDRDRAAADYYADQRTWLANTWINIMESGRLSSDCTIRDYIQGCVADRIGSDLKPPI